MSPCSILGRAGSLVGRRITAYSEPDAGEDWEAGYFSATVVAFNERASADKGRWLAHFDDGLHERIELPDPTVRIMTERVTVCRCKKLHRGTAGCCEGAGGSEPLPRPWEANPK